MNGWGILAWAMACGVGVLAFLTVVAHTVEWVTLDRRLREKRELGKNPENARRRAPAVESAA